MRRLMWIMLPVVAGVAALVLYPGGVASSNTANKSVVAPVFDHGRGIANTGAQIPNYLATLSEQEGRLIIREELQRAGVIDVRENKVLPELHNLHSMYFNNIFFADLYSDSMNIVVEFVSTHDDGMFGPGRNAMCYDCGHTYRFKYTAKRINEEVSMHCRGMYFASFYDPGLRVSDYAHMPVHYTSEEEKQRAINTVKQVAKSLLRNQVQDFVQWLDERDALRPVSVTP